MTKTYFLTGTDTDVGKTVVATALLRAVNTRGKKTLAMKPVAAGCEETAEGYRNNDALALHSAMNMELPYEQLNPVALKPAIAPHIAADQAGRHITVSRLAGFCRGVMMQRADFTLIEGAGGWRVPINSRETLADLAKELQLPVILVVGMRLGCINHALLTAEAIIRDGVPLAGWIANQIDSQMSCYQENLETLKQRLPDCFLGEQPYLQDISAIKNTNSVKSENYFNIDALL